MFLVVHGKTLIFTLEQRCGVQKQPWVLHFSLIYFLSFIYFLSLIHLMYVHFLYLVHFLSSGEPNPGSLDWSASKFLVKRA